MPTDVYSEPSPWEKEKATAENESQLVKKGNRLTRKIINSCLFTARKSLKNKQTKSAVSDLSSYYTALQKMIVFGANVF